MGDVLNVGFHDDENKFDSYGSTTDESLSQWYEQKYSQICKITSKTSIRFNLFLAITWHNKI